MYYLRALNNVRWCRPIYFSRM